MDGSQLEPETKSGLSKCGNRDYQNRRNWNGQWQNLGAPGISSAASSFSGLIVDSANSVYLSYSEDDAPNNVVLQKFSGGVWREIFRSEGAGDYPNLALGNDGVLYLSFQDIANGNKATVVSTQVGL